MSCARLISPVFTALLALWTGIATQLAAQEQNIDALTGAGVGLDEEIPDILSCPFDDLLAAYEAIYTDTDQIAYAAIFNEVTKICTERQTQVQLVLRHEQDLRSVLGALMAPVQITGTGPGVTEQCPAAVASVALRAPPVAVTPLQPSPVPNAVNLKEAKAEELESDHEVGRDTLSCAAPYQVLAILGSPVLGPDLNAVIFDTGTGEQLTVRTGDVLPGGITIEAISRDGVMVEAGGDRDRLPKRPAKPEVSDGGGLIYEAATVTELFDPTQSDAGALHPDQEVPGQ
ncbi:hypothetical protein [Ruegeria atlantica]|uniref:hypothetical protein n=1 Tax=Ruegeria atlantica TaxID=81569 RepID=UPI00147E3AFE|nr:hypothetical protein [Ruegeria atlantica]